MTNDFWRRVKYHLNITSNAFGSADLNTVINKTITASILALSMGCHWAISLMRCLYSSSAFVPFVE
jgi:hypothetical protein